MLEVQYTLAIELAVLSGNPRVRRWSDGTQKYLTRAGTLGGPILISTLRMRLSSGSTFLLNGTIHAWRRAHGTQRY